MAARKVTMRLWPVIIEGQIDRKTFKEIAAELGIHESNLWKVQDNPDFKRVRSQILDAFAREHGKRIAGQ